MVDLSMIVVKFLPQGKFIIQMNQVRKFKILQNGVLLVLMSVVTRSGLITDGEVAGDSITSVNGLAVMPTKESLIHHWI